MNRLSALLAFFIALPSLMAQGDYQKGVSYYQQNQYNKAIAEFEPLVKDHPDYEFGHRILGFCYLKTKRYDQAIASLREAIRLKNDNFSSYRALALAYFNSGAFKDALATMDRAENFAKSPRDKYEVHHTRGSAAYNLGNFSKAASDLEQAVAIQRGNLDDVLQLGIAYSRLNEFDKAEQYLQQALVLDPNHESAKLYLSRLKYQRAVKQIEKGQYQEASKSLREYVDSNPNDGTGWFNLGLAYLFADNLNAAEESFLRSVKISPENADAHNRLGYIYEKKKQYQQALRSYQKSLDLAKSSEAQENVDRIKKRLAQSTQTG